MPPILYMLPPSAPVRAVLMTANSIGLNLELKELNLFKGEHKTPEYLKLNPQHTLPTLVEDDGFVVWDSHAIMPYLITKYAKDDSLYPTDPKTRAIVNQRLHFDSGVATPKILQMLVPMIYGGKKSIDQGYVDAVHEVYSFVESFLDGRQWIAGDCVTIADFSFIATLTTVDHVIQIESSKYPKLVAYLKRAESLSVYHINEKGLDAFVAYVKPFLS